MTEVAFSLIGPLDVRYSGRPIVVTAPRQRSLLAALLVRANQPVSKRALCQAVWGERPSRRAEVTLRSYVMRLRRVLGPAVSARLTVQSSGYQLRLEQDDELDLRRLRACVREGTLAAQHEDWVRSLREFREGVRLWRGEPLCDVPSESLRLTVLPMLAELRTQLWEGLYAAAGRLGHVTEWVVPLQSLIADEPASERLSAVLMSALAQCNRRIDALAEFRRLRRVLISEQGIEPCPSVQELHRQLLREQSWAGGASRAPGVRLSAIVPKQLPRCAAAFAGRTRELGDLIGYASEEPGSEVGAPVAAINGLAGIGKSELAIAVAHRVIGHYPDGQLYAQLSTDQPVSVVTRFLRSLGVARSAQARDPDERFAQYRSLLADRRMLVVLDGAADADQVRPLIPGEESCMTLVTSWCPMSQLTEARCTGLGELPDADARAMLSALLGRSRVAAEPDATAAIIAACAGLPIALRVVAARLAGRPAWPLRYLADLLADENSRLDELSCGRLCVRASLAAACRTLTPPSGQQRRSARIGASSGLPLTAATALRLLGRWRRVTFTATEAAAYFGRLPAQVTPALEELVDTSLLAAPGPRSYRLHPLVRLFAIELASGRPADQSPASG